MSGATGFGIGVAGGTGTVNIVGGNVTVAAATAVGFQGGSGTLNIADTGAVGGALTGFGTGTASMSTGVLYVGDAGGPGVGTMRINTSGTITSSNVFIAEGGTGNVLMDAGNWNVTNSISIGSGAGSTGVVRIGGGTVTASGGVVDNNTRTPEGGFFIGNFGNGTLVQTGGAVSSNELNIANQPGSTGRYDFNGGTASFGELFMGTGAGSVATLNVGPGQTFLQNGWSEVGRNGGTGSINVDGAGAQFVANGNADFIIGANSGGTGFLNIKNGGSVTVSQWLNVARGAGSTGTITVDGPGSTLTTGGTFNGELNIGEDGFGTLNIINGGKVLHTAPGSGGEGNNLNIGRNDGGVGVVYVGPGSELLTNAWLRIGGQGINSKGTLTVDSGKLTVAGHLRVGNYGEGTLNAIGNADLNIGNGAQNHYIGTHNFPNTGTFNIADNALVKFGAGSYLEAGWAANNENPVGTGTLNQTGGLITSSSDPTGTGTAPAGDYLGLELGRGFGASGFYNLSNGTAFLRGLVVGRRGYGEAHISGGTLNIMGPDARMEIGEEPGGEGLVDITGGTLSYLQWFNVAANGSKGTLNFNHSNPATLFSSRDLYVGYAPGAVGLVNVF